MLNVPTSIRYCTYVSCTYALVFSSYLCTMCCAIAMTDACPPENSLPVVN